MTGIEVRHVCGQVMTVTEGELMTCPRCGEAFTVDPHPGMIDSVVLDQVLRRYGELLDAYLSAFRGRLTAEGIPDDLVDAEVSRVRARWAL